jgi:uncharacterized protein Usg
MANLSLQLSDYRLTTAEILYHMPDHPSLLQTFVWQDFDVAPMFPVLRRFLNFWQRELEAAFGQGRVRRADHPRRARFVTHRFHLH